MLSLTVVRQLEDADRRSSAALRLATAALDRLLAQLSALTQRRERLAHVALDGDDVALDDERLLSGADVALDDAADAEWYLADVDFAALRADAGRAPDAHSGAHCVAPIGDDVAERPTVTPHEAVRSAAGSAAGRPRRWSDVTAHTSAAVHATDDAEQAQADDEALADALADAEALAADEPRLLAMACWRRCRAALLHIREAHEQLASAARSCDTQARFALDTAAAVGDANQLCAPRAGGENEPQPPMWRVEQCEARAGRVARALVHVAAALRSVSIDAPLETLAHAERTIDDVRDQFDI